MFSHITANAEAKAKTKAKAKAKATSKAKAKAKATAPTNAKAETKAAATRAGKELHAASGGLVPLLGSIPLLADDDGWKRFRPTGCSRCRHVPGCTKSCRKIAEGRANRA